MKKIIVLTLSIIQLQFIFAQAPEWSKDKTIYEVNIRQYTPEGTFDAFATHLPRLEKMGVGILWMMPIQPIGELNRKGSLGSYYSISDYTATNPEFGSLKDFKKLVDEAHKRDMHVILDWVANHTSWDHVWMKKHPDFYTTDKSGKVIPPVADWSDVADLNYDNKAMRAAMIEDMKYWIKEADIDGFRCDVAMMVPDDFWKEAFTELRKIKPDIFLLAEAEGPQFHSDGFNMTYAWNKHHIMNEIAKGTMTADTMDVAIQKDLKNYTADSYFMNFTSNHDENSWNGTEYEKYGDLAVPLAVFSCMWNGIPLIYGGQELPNHKRLQFFDKDQIEWAGHPALHDFYKKLLLLRKQQPALLSGHKDVITWRIATDHPDELFCFVRKNKEHEAVIVLNFSNREINFQLHDLRVRGEFKNEFTGKLNEISADFHIEPWGYLVMTKQ